MPPPGSLTSLPGVGATTANRLARLGITNLTQLAEHFPRRYEDWTAPRSIHSLRIGEKNVVIKARIIKVEAARSARRRLHLVHATLEDETGSFRATWFNQPYLENTLKVGEIRLFRGTVGYDRVQAQKVFSSPSFLTTPKLLPVYPETAGLSSRQFQILLEKNWPAIINLPDTLPESVRQENELIARPKALAMIHRPQSLLEIQTAQRRFAFEEMFWFTLRLEQLRQTLAVHQAPSLTVETSLVKQFVDRLPFHLTDGQRRAAWQIIQDIKAKRPMNRLLNGDVGTGKTVIAALASFVAARAGYQTVWLTPTEILAEQHARTLSRFLEPWQIPVHLHTRSHRLLKKSRPTPGSVTVGTQAVFSEHEVFNQLGLVIIDEQHRFGVAQRAILKEERLIDGQKQVPHFLSMTATPIPRTLAFALYGNLDLSILNEYPAGRKTITTQVIAPQGRSQSYEFLRQELQAGRQAYVVCPFIEEGEEGHRETLFAEGQKSAVALAKELQTQIFPEFRIGLLHGQRKAKEKQQLMADFLDQRLDILVATSVIEVGIDVPNATVIVIEGADRFGLAQIHQLRGRVGRGEYQSFCFLMTESWSDVVRDRLKVVAETRDGFALAEADLKFRGPGQFFGTDQTGFPHFKLANLMDFSLMSEARAAAQKALAAGLTIPSEFANDETSAGGME